ncbi:LPS assembly lipoprotein LptE [Stenotrophobium rhamnosiphilum]|uniref:LPS-assembly lipoprotein LptE n=1 Tax=Stenotrophobium rhamnosiphilum TaxID=2029166 RepID=UPI001475CC46|nr:LPS assembly lipoprotein LptE [Stenotrophobium rhamnosiphilum]
MRITLAILLATLLAGCGFHLAGSRPLPEPLKTTYIDVIAPYRVSEPPLEVSLRTLIQRRGGLVKSSPEGARSIIKLSNLKESRLVLSIGVDGKVLEFQLVTSVTYQVNVGDKVLMPPDTLSLSRSYSFNAQQVLAKDAEEARLRQFIQNELAELLLLRMEAVLGRSVAETSTTAIPTVEPAGSLDAVVRP